MEMNLSNEQLDAAVMVLSMDTQQGSRMIASKLQGHWQKMQESGDPELKGPLVMSEDDCRIAANACALSNDEGAAALADMFAAGAGEGYALPKKPGPPEPEVQPLDPDLPPQSLDPDLPPAPEPQPQASEERPDFDAMTKAEIADWSNGAISQSMSKDEMVAEAKKLFRRNKAQR
jgi:hypothetical protein